MEIIVPKFSLGKSGSTKDIIVNLLVEEWPLTAKQIFERTGKISSKCLSYQAVHKVLSELTTEGVIEKQGMGYLLGKNWIEQIKKLGQSLSAVYSEEKTIPKSYTFEKPIFLTFNNLSEVGRFIIFEFHFALSNPPQKEPLCLWNHAWPVIALSDKEYAAVAGLFKCGKYHSLTRKNTALDKLFGEIIQKLGKKTITGVSFSALQDTFVHDDIICQVFFSSELIKQFDKIYNSVKTIDPKNLDVILNKLIGRECKINVLIFKNKELSDSLRKEVLEIFAKAKA